MIAASNERAMPFFGPPKCPPSSLSRDSSAIALNRNASTTRNTANSLRSQLPRASRTTSAQFTANDYRMSSELPIGIFDSGIGGLTVARQIHQLMPNEDLVYLGDTARVPYGTKSPGTVVRFACEDTQFLLQQNVKAVVVACNTCSAWAMPMLQRKFNAPVFGVIVPGIMAALEQTRSGRIGLIGTSATVRSKAYSNGLLARSDSAQVFAQACPLLVPLVEEGWINHPITQTVLKQYLAPLLRRRIDTLILGCTHYPLLKRAIRKVT